MAAVAKRLRSSMLYGEMLEAADIFEVHLIQSDATTHELVQNAKVHMCIVSSVALSHALFLDNDDDIALQAKCIRLAADLQKVELNTANENYHLMIRDLESTRCPSWEQRVHTAAMHPDRRSNTCFGFGLCHDFVSTCIINSF